MAVSKKPSGAQGGGRQIISALQQHVDARKGAGPPRFSLDVVEEKALDAMDTLTARDLSAMMNKFGKIGAHPGKEVLEGMERRGLAIINTYDAKGVALTLHAYAKLKTHPGRAMLEGLEGRAMAKIGDFIPQDLSNTLWAYATLGVTPGTEMLGSVERRAVAEMHRFVPQNIANTLWAYATLGVTPGAELLDAVEGQAVAEMRRFDPQNIANTLWAYATLEMVPGSELLSGLAAHGVENLNTGNFISEHLRQLHLFVVFLKLESSPNDAFVESLTVLEEQLGAAGRAAMADSKATVSDLQRQVVASVKRLGYDYEEETKDPVSGYSIDLLVQPSASSGSDYRSTLGIAIEVDGPAHFLSNTRQANGSTLLKRRLLKKLGYRVVSVPYWEWGIKDDNEHDAYLRRLLSVTVEDALDS
eukprot:CAMPEP_0174951136 /NCGR_PEP_ID=MMETSP1355-20121228/94694_1 /TAXON_ID=464990 /ORGANISM="Hemiselmis tepida, Strain CCMP443" /LENGTH=415 /DNA_ID=CAMNT_0016198783 /DNA_START=36 /DNA_END=1283 /DNA_ORIENTATION=-